LLGQKLHRIDGPAVAHTYGSQEWGILGKRRRLLGPAIIWNNGGKAWFLNNKAHRNNGPAKEINDTKLWCKYGLIHRMDGPAVIRTDGTKEWYLYGKKYTKEQFDWIKENNINLKTKEGKMAFRMRWR